MIVRPNSPPAPLTDEWKFMDEHERVNTPKEIYFMDEHDRVNTTKETYFMENGNKICLGPNSPTLNETLMEA